MSRKILIVDDAPDTVQILTGWLQDGGYETVVVRDASDALSTAARIGPVLILIDVQMPNNDGILCARALRDNPATNSVPIILLAAKNPIAARALVLITGAVDYVTTPINLQELGDSMHRVLRTESPPAAEMQHRVEEVVTAALEMVPCNLAWLFVPGSESTVLESRAVASSQGSAGIQLLVDHLGGSADSFQVPAVEDRNPLASVITSRHAALNLAVENLSGKPGTRLLYRGLQALGLHYLNILPLQIGSRIAGVLLLGHETRRDLDASAWRVITTLTSQAALLIDYGCLAEHLGEQEEVARAEHTFLTTVLDTMGDGLVVIDESGQIEYVNNRLLRMADYTREELTNQRIETLFHPDDRRALVYSLLHERGSTMKFDQRLYTKSGEVIPVVLSRSSFARLDPAAGQQVLVLSDMTVQKNRETALERYSQQLQALNQAAEAISSSLSRQEVINEILNSAVNTVNAQGASVLLRSSEAPNILVFAAAVGPEADRIQGMQVPISEGVAGWVVREARSQLVEDASQDSRFYEGIDHSSGLTTRSLIAVPLIVAEQVVGVLEVINKQSGGFDHVDVELLESIAGTAAVAIENARLFEQTRRRLNDLGTLLDASAAVSSTLDFGSVLELIARRLLDALDVERCEITAWDRNTNILESLAEVVDAYWPSGRGPLTSLDERPIRKEVLDTRRYQVFGLSDPRCPVGEREDLVANGQQAVVLVPLVVNQIAVGLARIYNGLTEQLAETDIDHVQRIVRSWLLHVEKHPQVVWHEVKPLTDLCNLLQAVPGVMWVTIEAWLPDQNQLQRLRETGFALWIEQGGIQQNLDDFPTMKRVLSIAQPKVVERATLENDPREQASLAHAGGEVCLLAPLLIRGQPEGLVKLIVSETGRSFDAEQISLCQGIANVVGNAMERIFTGAWNAVPKHWKRPTPSLKAPIC
jgi:PAS domain S-box-containing protein